jgi:putative nucleotidyltransferase with HDIG domain
VKKSNLPTRKQCFGLLKKFGIPSHIIEHSLATAKLAVFLAKRLNEKGILVDVQLVDRACLLHDILRVCDLDDYSRFEHSAADRAKWERLKAKYKGLCHEDAAAALLRDKYPQLAEVIRKHRYTAIAHQKDKPATWEEKLVYYADKGLCTIKSSP